MPSDRRSDLGTLVIAFLLLLALAFAGYWIVEFARGHGAPWRLLPWFGLAAAAIVVIGLVTYLSGGSGARGRRS